MHEFSITSQIVEEVLNRAKENKAKKVKSVHMTIGGLTFLGIDQVRFSYEVLTKDTIMQDSKLFIKKTRGIMKCPQCNYKGNTKNENDPVYHLSPFTYKCPKCGNKLEILRGNECTIRTIKMVA